MQNIADLYPLLEAIVAFMDEGVIIADERGEVLYQNPAASEMLGAAQAGPIGSLRDAGNVDLMSALERVAFETGDVDRHGRPGGNFIRFEKRVGRNGTSRTVEFHSGLVEVPSGDQRLRVVITQDRTEQRRLEAALNRGAQDLISNDPNMMDILGRVEQIAPTTASVLLQGESGTGKSQIARAIHRLSARAHRRLIEVNCAAIPESLIESELFGHVKGAFTGADKDRAGRFQMADKSTLFLDEISEIPLHLQAKLLRAIQEQEFEPLGSDRPVKVDVRVISASNQNLRGLVDAGEFRADLYYRLAVIPIHIPSLRQRPGDIPLLLKHFCKVLQSRGHSGEVTCSPEAMRLLMDYPWPGNVRELENAVEHGIICAIDNVVVPASLPRDVRDHHRRPAATPLPPASGLMTVPDEDAAADERGRVVEALEAAGGNRSQAARLLGVDRTTLWRRMRRLGLTA